MSTVNTTPSLLIQTHSCQNASEFLNILSRRSSQLRSRWPGAWIFRGHEDDKYLLVPPALRINISSPNSHPLTSRLVTNNLQQCESEFFSLKEFFDQSDVVGLHLPEDTQSLRHYFSDVSNAVKHPWPSIEILSLMALAQHHGLPTRLLDWSKHPLKAALFAAMGASEAIDKTGNLSVWCLSLELLLLANGLGFGANETSLAPFIHVTAPGATNSNLNAQEGVFTVAQRVNMDDTPIDRTPFDEKVLMWSNNGKKGWSGGPWFHRVTLPKIQADLLCRELAFEGITPATLFPNFSGVVRACQFQDKWMHL